MVLLRAAFALAPGGDRFEVAFTAGVGLWLLVVSYRWFAVRWGVMRAADPPAP